MVAFSQQLKPSQGVHLAGCQRERELLQWSRVGEKKGGKKEKKKKKKKKEKKSRFPFYLTNALLQYDDRCLRLGLNLRESSMSSAALHCAWVESLPGFLIPNPWGYIEMGKRNKTSCLFQFSLSIALVVFRWVLKGCFFFFFFFSSVGVVTAVIAALFLPIAVEYTITGAGLILSFRLLAFVVVSGRAPAFCWRLFLFMDARQPL
ncbi:hypothetical protein MAP00_003920 [Monascus purpureus]|nr:hypothetical protein MAP00_003920 [Monascus purpureus]